MKRFFLGLFFVGVTFTAVAQEYAGHQEVGRIRLHTDGQAYVATIVQPSNTCSNWGEYLKFDHTSEAGKSILSSLLASKMSGSKVSFWYTTSGAPGKDQHSGCAGSNISNITAVAVN